MKTVALSYRVRALCVAVLFLAAVHPDLRGQAPSAAAAPKVPTPEEVNQAELMRSYLQVREQLHATQLAVVNNRVEAETAARVQTAALAEKLEAIKSAMVSERERHQAETLRLNAERERQQTEAQRSVRTALWIAAVFGAVGLLALIVLPFFQWRAINRMAEVASLRPALSQRSSHPYLAISDGEAGESAVALSNQRLASVVERMERRILELESTVAHPLPSTASVSALPPEVAVKNGASIDHGHRNGTAGPVIVRELAPANPSERIAMLLSKARTLLTTNHAKEAIACYDEILKLDVNHAEALVKKGAALERLMRNEEALRCYDRAIQVDAKLTLAYLYKGGVCNRLGRYDEALQCYEQALQAQEEGK